MTAKLHKVRSNFLFDYRYFDPIDRLWVYCNLKDAVCFGAATRIMGKIKEVIPAKINLSTMMVEAIV